MATPTEVEYTSIDGLPLDTPAWQDTNPEWYLGAGDVAGGGGQRAAYAEGEEAAPTWPGPRRVDKVVEIRGERDPDGNAHPSLLTGIRRNTDTLKRVLRPRFSGDGTVPLRVHLADDTDREGRCQITGPVQPVVRGGVVVRAVIPLWLPAGVLRDVTPTVVSGSGSAAFQLAVPNPGSVDQLDAQITLTGTATAVEITSPAYGGLVLTFTGALGGGVVIDTGEFTALRDGLDVHGLVSAQGPGRWLPAGLSPNLLTADAAAIESGTGGWAGVNGTVDRDTAAGHPVGDAAVKVSSDGSSVVARGRLAPTLSTDVVGRPIVLSAFVRPFGAESQMIVREGGAVTANAVVAVTPGVWQRISLPVFTPGAAISDIDVIPVRKPTTLTAGSAGWFAGVQIEPDRLGDWTRTDTWTVTPTGGSVTAEVSHRAAWA